ncbi:MAG: baseplate hub protein [Wolbachia sp.]
MSIGNILYKSSSGFTASSIILNSNLKTDNLEIDVILNNDNIKEEDVLLGKYDLQN